MKASHRIALLAVALTLAAPAGARADLIPWKYDWGNSNYHDTTVPTDNGLGGLLLHVDGTVPMAGTSSIGLGEIFAQSTAPADAPDVFTDRAYSLPLRLTDVASGQSGTLTFTAVLNGTVSVGNAKIGNPFTSDTTQSIVLGNNLYTATIGPFVPPGPPGWLLGGNISGHVTVEPLANVQATAAPLAPASVPEPSGLVLAGLGLAAGCAVRKRPRARR